MAEAMERNGLLGTRPCQGRRWPCALCHTYTAVKSPPMGAQLAPGLSSPSQEGIFPVSTLSSPGPA